MKHYKVYIFVLGVVLLDHIVKLWVHFNIGQGFLGQITLLGNWLKIQYELNSGMAFGVEWGSTYGKLALTIFRLLATVGILFYLKRLIKRYAHSGLIYCIALILGGAIGNLIDSMFYGVLLNNAPADAPIALFYGQVIDMIYIDLVGGYLPNWIPFIGGKYAPATVFNIADAAIFIGVIVIIVRQKRFFARKRRKKYKTLA